MARDLTGRFGIGQALLRVVVGAVFIAHGVQKAFVYGHSGVAMSFGRMGVPAPDVTSLVVMLVELAGGVALVLGVFTRWAAALLAIDMLSALVLVHARNGFFLPMGYEFVLTLLAALLALLIGGPGRFTLAQVLRRRDNRYI